MFLAMIIYILAFLAGVADGRAGITPIGPKVWQTYVLFTYWWGQALGNKL